MRENRRGDDTFVSKRQAYQVAANAKVSRACNFAGDRRGTAGPVIGGSP